MGSVKDISNNLDTTLTTLTRWKFNTGEANRMDLKHLFTGEEAPPGFDQALKAGEKKNSNTQASKKEKSQQESIQPPPSGKRKGAPLPGAKETINSWVDQFQERVKNVDDKQGAKFLLEEWFCLGCPNLVIEAPGREESKPWCKREIDDTDPALVDYKKIKGHYRIRQCPRVKEQNE